MTMQTIYRVAHRDLPYSQLGNAMLRDRDLSIEARGALAMVLSYPPNWTVTLHWIAEMCGVGRDKARNIIRELEGAGYCKRARQREKDGTLGGYEFLFTDARGTLPDTDAPAPEKPALDRTSDAKPAPGEPTPENPTPSKEREQLPKIVPNIPLNPPEGEAPMISFEAFWDAYPIGTRAHTKKVAARKAWEAIIAGVHREGHKATPATMIEAARRYAATKPDPDYVPLAATWLNTARWTDAPEVRRGYGDKARDLWSNPNWSGATVHDTGETLRDYTLRMIREGKLPPSAPVPPERSLTEGRL